MGDKFSKSNIKAKDNYSIEGIKDIELPNLDHNSAITIKNQFIRINYNESKQNKKTINDITVENRNLLLTQPDLLFRIGLNYDGLPLLLKVRRRYNIYSSIPQNILNDENKSDTLVNAMDTLQSEVDKYSVSKGIYDHYYRTNKTLEALVGPNLLCMIFGSDSPLNHDESNSKGRSALGRQRQTSAIMMRQTSEEIDYSDSDQELPNETTNEKKSWVNKQRVPPKFEADLNKTYTDQNANLASRGQNYEFKDEFISESLRGMTFAIIIKHRNNDNKFNNSKYEYMSVWGHEISKLNDYMKNNYLSEEIHISYAIDIRRVLVGVASLASKQLKAMHESGIIHGDISPSNLLVHEEGLVLIDEMGTKLGNKSAGGTPGWCAPEQSIGEPVSEKTDVYALGLLVALLVDGVLVGEESAYWIASKQPGDTQYQRKRIVILKNPRVSLNKKYSKLKDIIESCLKFEQEDRVTIEEFVTKLKSAVMQLESYDYWKYFDRFKSETSLKTVIEADKYMLAWETEDSKY